MSIRDEQTTHTTAQEEPVRPMTSMPSPDEEAQGEAGFLSHASLAPGRSSVPANGYSESNDSAPHWEEFQEPHYGRQWVTARSAIFGGLSGGIFFIGLAVAILSGHFWPVFLVALALTALLGPLGSSKAQAIYGGFQGCVFFLGLAICSIYNWWWPWVLVLLGIEAILGIGNAGLSLWPVARPGITVDQYYTALRNHDYAQAYRFLDASLNREQFTSMARQCDEEEGTASRYTIAPDLAITTNPLPGEPLPLVTFARDPAEHLTVTVRRTHAPSYLVHLQMRQVGKAWKISAFDRI